MSLEIKPEDVIEVLLVDGWHKVEQGTFGLDAYEYVEKWYNWDQLKTHLLFNGDQNGCAIGFEFIESDSGDRVQVTGPMTSIIAIKHKRSGTPKDPNWIAAQEKQAMMKSVHGGDK